MNIKAGQIVVVTDGEYSDYCLRGAIRALRDFDVKEAESEFLRQLDTNEDHLRLGEMWLAWLIRRGFVEPADSEIVELYVGSYGQLKPEVIERKIEIEGE